MTEKIILKETITKGNPEVESKPKKKYYKPRKKREIIEVDIKDLDLNHVYVKNGSIKKPEQVGSYKVGKSFNIFFDKKPNAINRLFAKLLLGWEWQDQKIKK
jgi:hypothetical protein